MTNPNNPKKRKTRTIEKVDVFNEFAIWTSIAEPLRDPKTHQEFAQKFGVSPDTLVDWKKRDDFWELVMKEWKKWGISKSSNVMQAFYQKLLSKGVGADYKLWFQYFLDWQEKMTGMIESKDLQSLTQAIKNIAEKKYDKPIEHNGSGNTGGEGSGPIPI